MISIKPTEYGRGRIATKINISLLSFSTDATSCSTYWNIYDEEGKSLEQGNTNIPEEVYNAWAQDNVIIENYVLTELQLEREV